jgi:hypothetical protein
MRSRLFPAFAISALVVYAAMPAPVAARWISPDTSGYCASGTCSRFGGIRAANIKNCKPENCRDYTAVSFRTIAPAKKSSCAEASAWPSSASWPWSWLWPRHDCGAADEK